MVFKEGAKEELEGLILNFLIDNTDYSEKDFYEPDETEEEPLRLNRPTKDPLLYDPATNTYRDERRET